MLRKQWQDYALKAKQIAKHIVTGLEQNKKGVRLTQIVYGLDMYATDALNLKYSKQRSKSSFHTYQGGRQEISTQHADGSEGLFKSNGEFHSTNNPMDIEVKEYMNNSKNESKNMNKKLIRLTESDLHRIVKESVNRILNEIGDTPKGQLALGAVAGRANVRGNRNTEIAASNKAWDRSMSKNPNMNKHYDSGYELGKDMERDKQLKQRLASRLKESRFSKYKYANNPLFSKDEAEYWDTLEYPNDEEYYRILQLAKQVDYNTLYKKLGHDKFNAFMCRLEEDDPDFHEKYTAINRDELPF